MSITDIGDSDGTDAISRPAQNRGAPPNSAQTGDLAAQDEAEGSNSVLIYLLCSAALLAAAITAIKVTRRKN